MDLLVFTSLSALTICVIILLLPWRPWSTQENMDVSATPPAVGPY